MRTVVPTLAAFIVMALCAQVASAASITYEAVGSITSVTAGLSGASTETMQMNDPFRLLLTVDDSVVDGSPSDVNGIFAGAVTSYSIELTAGAVGTWSGVSGGARTIQTVDSTFEQLLSGLVLTQATPLGDSLLRLANLNFVSTPASGALDGTAGPTLADQLGSLGPVSKWSTNHEINFADSLSEFATGTFTSIEVYTPQGQVPEPSSLSLLGLGVVAALAWRRRRGGTLLTRVGLAASTPKRCARERWRRTSA